MQLRQLVALREQAWPRIQHWYNRRAAAAAGAAPCASAALPHLLRWAVVARLVQLRRIQQQWQAAQAVAPPAPEPAQQQALTCEVEASTVLLQLSKDAASCQPQQASAAGTAGAAGARKLPDQPAAKRRRVAAPVHSSGGAPAAC